MMDFEIALTNNIELLPKVTIMIPTYNQEKYIVEAIESTLSQDYLNLEVVISDDCSSDATSEIIQRFLLDNRVKYFKNPQNLGRVRNYHKTLYDYATGDWVVNLDGDDYFVDSTFISDSIKLIQDNENIVFVLASCNEGVKRARKKVKHTSIGKEELLLSGKDFFLSFFKTREFFHHSLIYNRNKAKEVGFYVNDSLISDFHSAMRLALRGNVILSSKKVAHWRTHDSNSSITETSTFLIKNTTAFIEIANDARQFLAQNELKKWEEESNKFVKDRYILTVALTGTTLKEFLYVLSNFRLKKWFISSFIKMILRNLNISNCR